MRLKHITVLVLVVALIGGGIWFFVNGTHDGATGAGGLPLIKADTNPVKLPPDDPGGEIMPNADSTVFPAIAGNAQADPSMQDLKLPTSQNDDTSASAPDFAGLKTGFAIPQAPEKKVESLFDTAPKSVDMANEETQPKNEYISGIAPDALKDTTTPAPVQEPAPAPAPVVQDTPPAPAPIANDESNVAQNMEAQEKAIVIPPSKPQVPESKPAAPEAKKETVSPAQTVAADIANEAYVAPKQPKTPVPAVKSGYYMQLASTPLKAEAPIIWSKLLKKYPDALSGLKANYQPASVPGKGDYIRVQAGPLTQSEANNRCKQLHRIDPKGGCLVLKR